MKLKVAVITADTEFMRRLARIFQQNYQEKVSLYLFSNPETMYQSLQENHVELLLIDQDMELNSREIPEGITAGCLTKIPDAREVNGLPAVCKYQKAESIYKDMLSIYAESSANIRLKKGDSSARIILFMSAQGGCGTSSAAVAYALRRAQEKKRVFYLTMERFGNTEIYFKGDGNLSFSDVIYSLKSKNSNLQMKLESAVQTDESGVEFLKDCKNAYDIFELTDDETRELIEGIRQVRKYDEIILDFSSDLWSRMISLADSEADKIVYVSDGTMTGNHKFEKFCQAARILERRKNYQILDKTSLLYNRYSSSNSIQMEKTAVPVIGGIHRIEGISGKELAGKIAQMDCMSSI